MQASIETLAIPEAEKARLKALTPHKELVFSYDSCNSRSTSGNPHSGGMKQDIYFWMFRLTGSLRTHRRFK